MPQKHEGIFYTSTGPGKASRQAITRCVSKECTGKQNHQLEKTRDPPRSKHSTYSEDLKHKGLLALEAGHEANLVQKEVPPRPRRLCPWSARKSKMEVGLGQSRPQRKPRGAPHGANPPSCPALLCSPRRGSTSRLNALPWRSRDPSQTGGYSTAGEGAAS